MTSEAVVSRQRVGKGTWHLFQRLSVNNFGLWKRVSRGHFSPKVTFFSKAVFSVRDREAGYPGPGGKGSLLDQTLLGLL